MKVIYISPAVPSTLLSEATSSRVVENNMATGIAEMLYASFLSDLKCFTLQPRLKNKGYAKISRHRYERLNDNIDTEVFPCMTTPMLSVIIGFFVVMFKLNRYIAELWAKGERDICVVTYNSLPPASVVMLLMQKRKYLKTVCVLLDSPVIPMLSSRFKNIILSIWNLFAIRVFKNYDGAMSVAEACVKNFNPIVPYMPLLPGVTKETLDSSSELPILPVSDTIELIYAGNLTRFNGVDTIVEVMSLLPANYRLTIYGTGTLTKYVTEKSMNNPQIVYKGFVPHERVMAEYAKSHLLMIIRCGGDKLSDWLLEYGTSSKLAEMLLTGKPVITNSIRANPKSFERYLNIVEAPDHKSVADMILKITKDNASYVEAVNKAREGRRFYLENATWEKQAAQACRFIDSLFN